MADDCSVKHPALTALDHASMLAAYTASFVGIYGRQPTLQPGSGVDDGGYWISVSDHYGAFSDGVCRAGWSAYWEAKLRGSDSASPALGDLPAQFQPGSPVTPPVPDPQPQPEPNPQPAPVPVVDRTDEILAAVKASEGRVIARIDVFENDAKTLIKQLGATIAIKNLFGK